tara:strand:+ start:1464 stop:1772 length:309 start_codon:yes stop_codon:yes gene_type:complete
MGRTSKYSNFFKSEPHAPAKNHDNKIFVAILHQAVRDAFISSDGLARRAARAWLVGNSERFRFVCECAGREASYVQQKVKKKIEEEKNENTDMLPMPWERVY